MLITAIVISDVTQEIVHKLAMVWHNPGTWLKKCSPSILAENIKEISLGCEERFQ